MDTGRVYVSGSSDSAKALLSGARTRCWRVQALAVQAQKAHCAPKAVFKRSRLVASMPKFPVGRYRRAPEPPPHWMRTGNFRPRPPGSNFVTKVQKVQQLGRGDPFRVVQAPRSPHQGGTARWRHRGGMRGRKRPRQGRAAGASPCLPARPLSGAISGGETPACPTQPHDFY
jgi:hypothetical protein